jgi:hypothetical protein
MDKDRTRTEKDCAKAEIMHMFRHMYRDKWAPENIFANRSRVWTAAFNELVKDGFVIRRKSHPGYKYRWGAAWPDNY